MKQLVKKEKVTIKGIKATKYTYPNGTTSIHAKIAKGVSMTAPGVYCVLKMKGGIRFKKTFTNKMKAIKYYNNL